MKKFRVWAKQLLGDEFETQEQAEEFCMAEHIPEDEDNRIIIEGYEDDEL